MGALVALGSACVVVVTVVLVRLWSRGDQNIAGWVTTVVVFGAAWLFWEALGLGDAFRRASRRRQWIVIVLTLALAMGGSLVYLVLPGTASWYLATLPAIPALLVLLSFPRRGQGGGPLDVGDGPWTAP